MEKRNWLMLHFPVTSLYHKDMCSSRVHCITGWIYTLSSVGIVHIATHRERRWHQCPLKTIFCGLVLHVSHLCDIVGVLAWGVGEKQPGWTHRIHIVHVQNWATEHCMDREKKRAVFLCNYFITWCYYTSMYFINTISETWLDALFNPCRHTSTMVRTHH